ncbi:MAG: SDR family oxidoreductase [Microbacterium sp.]
MTALPGAVVLITGAASGIGRGIATAFARRGARIVAADLDAFGAGAVADEIRARGGQAIGVAGDVTQDGAFERFKDAGIEAFGAIDVVANNVGAITRGLPEHVPVEEWRRIIEVNLISMVRSNLVFIPYFLERGRGHIVNTGSFAGLFPYAYDRLPYVAAKAAVVQVSESLRLYLEPRGVGVTLLTPGPVRTNISSSLRSFGPPTLTRPPGPEFEFVLPEDVGQRVADAVEAGVFWVTTHDGVVDKLRARAADWDGFIADQIEALHD